MFIPISMQASLDGLVGLNLIAEEFHPEGVPMPRVPQLARSRFQDLLFPYLVIDPLPAKEFRGGHFHAKYKAPGGNVDYRVEKDPVRNGSRGC